MARRPSTKTKLSVVGGNDGHTPPGHNSGATMEQLSDEQQQFLFLQNLGKIKAAKTAVGAASSALRNLYKIAKADGFTKKEIDFALDLEKDQGEVMTKERRREAQIARWMSHPIGTQADLFETGKTTDDRPLRDRAFDEGKRDGMISAGPLKPPYDPGSEGYDGYVEGWRKGQEVLAQGITKTSEPNLLRPEGGDSSGPDDFDEASENGGLESEWPDDDAVKARKAAEAAAAGGVPADVTPPTEGQPAI